jgi:hypothetical protein
MRFFEVVQRGWCFDERRVCTGAPVNRVRDLRVNKFAEQALDLRSMNGSA